MMQAVCSRLSLAGSAVWVLGTGALALLIFCQHHYYRDKIRLLVLEVVCLRAKVKMAEKV